MPASSTPTSSMPASASPGKDRPLRRVVLFAEDEGGDWHAGGIIAGLEARGLEVHRTTLKECAFDTSAKCGLRIPGFGGELPDGAFVRAISTGCLEQITFRLGILHALGASGVRVWNSASVIERCVDKSTATFLFHRAGLPTPATLVVEGATPASAHARDRDVLPLVVKPLFGSQGNGVRLISEPEDLPGAADLGGVYYLQAFQRSEAFEDYRVLVSSGRVVAGMRRRGPGWVTNMHQGAKAEPLNPDNAMQELAVGAANSVGADYAGVDMLRGSDGRLMVLEINSNPAWRGLQSVTDVDIADRLAADFAETLGVLDNPHMCRNAGAEPVR